MISLLMIFCLLGLGSAWSQPSTCFMRQSSCSGDSDYIRRIAKSLEKSLESISSSLEQLAAQNRDCPTTCTDSPTELATTTEPPPLIGSFDNPASSCSDIPQDSPSEEYWINNSTGSPVQVYCDMNRTSCSCNSTGGWMRVANLDMTDPNQNCPAGFRLVTRTSAPLRTCGRPGPAGCVSTSFQTYGVEYSHVCGRVTGYQQASPDAFSQYVNSPGGREIDSFYVDGVSLTHGQSPRQHIWTFAGAVDETVVGRQLACPCTQPDIPYLEIIPSFVGQDYFCDTGSREALQFIFYPDDPLWDGQGCGGNSTCCEFNNPPWFCKQLSQSTTDNIELRICGDQSVGDEDTPIEQVVIYIR